MQIIILKGGLCGTHTQTHTHTHKLILKTNPCIISLFMAGARGRDLSVATRQGGAGAGEGAGREGVARPPR